MTEVSILVPDWFLIVMTVALFAWLAVEVLKAVLRFQLIRQNKRLSKLTGQMMKGRGETVEH